MAIGCSSSPVSAPRHYNSPYTTHSLYCTVLYSTVLYCTVLYCTLLYCTTNSCGSILAPLCRGQLGERPHPPLSTIYALYLTLYTLFSILYTLHSTIYTRNSTFYIIVCIVICVLCNEPCSVFSVQCRLHAIWRRCNQVTALRGSEDFTWEAQGLSVRGLCFYLEGVVSLWEACLSVRMPSPFMRGLNLL